VDDADTPNVAVVCGTLAMQAGDVDAAAHAVTRALVLAPGFAGAAALGARVALLQGRLDDARKDLDRLDPATKAQVKAILAYEAGDLGGLAPAATPADRARPSPLIDTLRARLLGARPVEPARLQALAGGPWADIVAADAALDEGDLPRAHQIIGHWSDAAKHPVRALRLARLLRYDGDLEKARAALLAAAPSRLATIERALLDAEVKEERERTAASLDDKLEPERKWLQAYLRARQGSPAAAKRAVAKLDDPAPDAPRTLRLAAGLALGELQDKARGEPIVQPLVNAFPKNPDVTRAAVGVGLVKPPKKKK